MRQPAEAFKILGVDTRLKIIENLKRAPMTVNALAEVLGITQSAVSQHLRILKQAGLVDDERKGYWVYYSLNEDVLNECKESLMMACSCGCCCDSGQKPAGQDKKVALTTYKQELKKELRRVESLIQKLEE